MDHSYDSAAEAIQGLKTFTTCDEVTALLPRLEECFVREEDFNVLPEIISLLLSSAVQSLPLQVVDHAILQPFLPLVKQCLIKTLSSAATRAALEVDIPKDALVLDLTKNIQICGQIMTDVDNLLSYVISLNSVSVKDVFHLPKNVAEIVYQVFVHCQKSEKTYKQAFAAVRGELMSLFKKSHQVQVNLYKVLNEKLHFKCTFEDELQLLVDVLEILNTMAEVVADLDTLSLVIHWKGYAQLTQTYATHLCPRLDVARPINYLAAKISHQVANLRLYLSQDIKATERSLKISSLQMKVLIKLCEQYKGYLGDCHIEVLSCLISLTAHTNQYLIQKGVTVDIAAKVTTSVSAGAAPLLAHLIADCVFVKEYLQYADRLHSYDFVAQLGYCNLTNLILKTLTKLCSTDDDAQDLWLRPTLPIIKTVFKLLDECSSKGELFMVNEEDMYRGLLVHTTAFLVVTCTKDMFFHLEKELIKHLLQPRLWPALFSSDLLCLIARIGSSTLCLQLTNLLNDMLSCWPACDRHRPEWVYLSWTRSRLILLLSSDHQKAFPSRLPPLPSLISDITKIVKEPFSHETPTHYQSLVVKLTLIGDNLVKLPDPDHTLTEALFQLWQLVSVPSAAKSTESAHWFLEFYSVLMVATCNLINTFSNYQLAHILDVLIKVSDLNTTLFACGSCEFLRCLATKILSHDSSQALVCQRISLLFVQLMQNQHPITKQLAMEAFSFFAHVTKYEQVVADCVAVDSLLPDEITSYFEGVVNVHCDTPLVEHLKSLKQDFVHKCEVMSDINTADVEEPEPTPCKKMKTSRDEDSVAAALLRMEQDLSVIEEYKNNSSLNEHLLISMQTIYTRLDKLMKPS